MFRKLLVGHSRSHLIMLLQVSQLLDAYGTGAFGERVTRSDESQQMLERLATLNQRELRGELTEVERAEQEQLRRILPTEAAV